MGVVFGVAVGFGGEEAGLEGGDLGGGFGEEVGVPGRHGGLGGVLVWCVVCGRWAMAVVNGPLLCGLRFVRGLKWEVVVFEVARAGVKECKLMSGMTWGRAWPFTTA